MNNYNHQHQGDLADIVRASGSIIGSSITSNNNTIMTTATATQQDWQFGSPNPDLYQQFPDPPVLSLEHNRTGVADGGSFCSDHTGPNMLPRAAIQISPHTRANNSNNSNNNNDNDNTRDNTKLPLLAAASSRVIKADYGSMSSKIKLNIDVTSRCISSSRKEDGFLDNNTDAIQIHSPRNPGIKRRKSQPKKVVCIPAPAMANSRQTGEVVPSDLWAWRKYGQKPIKDSPYPRGYYRCSSSKGCSARKQVERSRTDPKMLVITYTSEHNHPWPTQRNALAGSTRSQPLKTSSQTKTRIDNNKEAIHETDGHSNARSSITTSSILNEEVEVGVDENKESKGEEYNKSNQVRNNDEHDHVMQSNRPIMAHEHQQPDQDFFADLVEFEGNDPLNLMFTHESKALDPFGGIFDWGMPSDVTTTNSNDNDMNSPSSG